VSRLYVRDTLHSTFDEANPGEMTWTLHLP